MPAKDVLELAQTDSESEGSDVPDAFRINKDFANEYMKRKEKHALARLKERGETALDSDESSSSSEDEDEDGELLTSHLDRKIASTISMLKRKDPAIYDSGKKFFDAEDTEADAQARASAVTSSNKKGKQKFYKDVVREALLKDGGLEDDSDSEGEREGGSKGGAEEPSYHEEQEQLKREFLQSVKKESAPSSRGKKSEGEEEADDDLFTVKTEGASAHAGGEEIAWDLGDDEEDQEGSKFLREYMQNKGWMERDWPGSSLSDSSTAMGASKNVKKKGEKAEGSDSEPEMSELVFRSEDEEEDEEAVDAADDFEKKYNFRFEEEGGAEIQSYARSVPGSMRRSDEKRKTQRQLRKERKEADRRRKEEELRRLKNLKKKELAKKLHKVLAMAGLTKAEVDGDEEGEEENLWADKKFTSKGLKALDLDVLEEDFDPDAHDKKMAEMFGEDYYEADDVDERFQEKSLGGEGADEDEDVDKEEDMEWEGAWEVEDRGEQEHSEGEEQEEREEAVQAARKEAKRLRDELYALDYEDIIGDLPTRFKYAEVPANDFGLSAEEVLLTEDKELNSYVSLKKIAPYREKEWQVHRNKRKKFRQTIKKKLKEQREANGVHAKEEKSSKGDTQSEEAASAVVSDHGDKQTGGRKRKRSRKKKGEKGDSSSEKSPIEHPSEGEKTPVPSTHSNAKSDAVAQDVGKSAKKKQKRSKKSTEGPCIAGVSASRLNSYLVKHLRK